MHDEVLVHVERGRRRAGEPQRPGGPDLVEATRRPGRCRSSPGPRPRGRGRRPSAIRGRDRGAQRTEQLGPDAGVRRRAPPDSANPSANRLSRPHRPDRVGRRRPDADRVQVERGERHQRDPFDTLRAWERSRGWCRGSWWSTTTTPTPGTWCTCVAAVTGVLPTVVQHDEDGRTRCSHSARGALARARAPRRPARLRGRPRGAARAAAVPVLGVCLGHAGPGHDVRRHGRAGRRPRTATWRGPARRRRGVRRAPVAVRRGPLPLAGRAPACPTTWWSPRAAPATDGAEVVMGVRHVTLPLEGVQFHPESILSEHGARLVANFLGAVVSDPVRPVRRDGRRARALLLARRRWRPARGPAGGRCSAGSTTTTCR